MSHRYRDNREEMVRRQIAGRRISNPDILNAFREVPREAFLPEDMQEFAYEDAPLPIGEGQTISQPFIVARMIDAAGIAPGDTVLEVGAGSGYAAAVISRIAREVTAIERHETLATQASRRIEELGYENCSIIAGDGTKGCEDRAPFDAILVAARTATVPEPLKRQLKIGGRLVIPVGDESLQQLRLVERTGEQEWVTQDIAPVRFVPLLDGMVPEDGSHAGSNHSTSVDRTPVQVIADEARPLPGIADPHFAEAFDHYADKRVVMLGECSHGTHEFYAARAAITRHLVERHGFTIIAVEGDWPDAAAYDRYIKGQQPRSEEPFPFTRFPTWMWRNTVMPGLLDDLRKLNQSRGSGKQIGFYGLDIYNMHGSIEAVLGYLDEHDPDAAEIARKRYGCLTPWQSDPAAYGQAALRQGYAECEDAVVAQCQELLQRALEQDGESFGAAMNARLISSAEHYYRIMYYGGAASWNLRDSHMAETLSHLLDQGGEDAKAIVWAHNSHIGDARATEMGAVRKEHNLGQLARERWGDQVALIGFGTHSGTVTAATDWGGEREIKAINPSRRDSYEWLCHDTGIPRFLLDLPSGSSASHRLSDPLLQRFIGVIYRPETERWSHYSESVLPRQYDAYCWFDETSALEPLAEHEPKGWPAETFPFGV